MKNLLLQCLLLLFIPLTHAQNDPQKTFCIMKNSTIKIRVSYEFRLIDNAFPEQRYIVADCPIDENGYITVPSFYNSIEPANAALTLKEQFAKEREGVAASKEMSDYERESELSGAYEKQYDKYRFKLNGIDCGKNCMTYFEAGWKFTNFYQRKIGPSTDITNIYVTVLSEGYFQTITVFYKGKEEVLPYKDLDFGTYFGHLQVKYQLGLKKCVKVSIHNRCKKESRESHTNDIAFKYRFNCNHNATNPHLEAGDIIYIK